MVPSAPCHSTPGPACLEAQQVSGRRVGEAREEGSREAQANKPHAPSQAGSYGGCRPPMAHASAGLLDVAPVQPWRVRALLSASGLTRSIAGAGSKDGKKGLVGGQRED